VLPMKSGMTACCTFFEFELAVLKPAAGYNGALILKKSAPNGH
jgi:hypothetical protein